jgi:hypothetical protein
MFARLRLCNDYKALPLVWEYGFDNSPAVRVAVVQASERTEESSSAPPYDDVSSTSPSLDY